MSYSQKSHVAIAFQNSYGTANVASLHHIQVIEENVGLDIPPLVDMSNKGIFDEGDGYQGPKGVSGDMTINAKSIPLGVLLRGAMGAASVTATSSSFAHSFKPRTTDFDDLSAEDPLTYFKYTDDGGSAQLFYDLNIGTLELGATNGEFVTAKATFIGGSFSQNADIAASYNTGKRFTWDNSSVQLNGSAAANFRQLTITLDNALEAMHTLSNSKFPSRVKRTGERTIEVAGTVIFDDQTEYQHFIDSDEIPLVVSFAGPVDVGSGGPDEIVIDMPALRLSEFKPPIGGPGKIEVSFTGNAKYLSTSATAIEITLTNTVATY